MPDVFCAPSAAFGLNLEPGCLAAGKDCESCATARGIGRQQVRYANVFSGLGALHGIHLRYLRWREGLDLRCGNATLDVEVQVLRRTLKEKELRGRSHRLCQRELKQQPRFRSATKRLHIISELKAFDSVSRVPPRSPTRRSLRPGGAAGNWQNDKQGGILVPSR